MSPLDDFVSSNVEITLSTSLGVTRWKKRVNCNVFALDLYLYTGVVFVLINNTFDCVWFT